MREKELELLGFTKEYTDTPDVYYYVYDFNVYTGNRTEDRTYISLITNKCSDEIQGDENGWTVSIFDSSSLVYKTYNQVKAIIDAIENVDAD